MNGMKEIKLSQTGKNKILNLVALVDDEDFEYLNQFKWHVIPDKNTCYAARSEYKDGNTRQIQMHRQLLELTNPKIQGEHRDGNGLNNQRYNLRIATHSQNMANRASFKNTSSKYAGVAWLKKNKTWVAYITKDSIRKYLGCFKNENEAALKYNDAAIQLHGEFANLNKITA